MNRETAHAVEKSSLYFSSDKLAGQPDTLNSPQNPGSSLPVLPGDVRLLFPALHSLSEALQSHTPKSCRGLWATFLRGLHPSPAGEGEMQAKRDGQAVGREELGGGREHQDEHRQEPEGSTAGKGEAKQSHTIAILYKIGQQGI